MIQQLVQCIEILNKEDVILNPHAESTEEQEDALDCAEDWVGQIGNYSNTWFLHSTCSTSYFAYTCSISDSVLFTSRYSEQLPETGRLRRFGALPALAPRISGDGRGQPHRGAGLQQPALSDGLRRRRIRREGRGSTQVEQKLSG